MKTANQLHTEMAENTVNSKPTSAENDKSIHRAKIAIIGGGVSGLAAANTLLEKGESDFVILEGRTRLGGRVIGIPLGPYKVELGANWVHGVLGNPLYELALRHGLVDILQSPKPHRMVGTTENGRRIPFSILQEVYEAYFWFFKKCEEYYLRHTNPPAGLKSVADHLNHDIAKYLHKFSNPSERLLRQLLFDYLITRETCISGCHSMDQVDLKAIGSYAELPGGNITLPNGYSSILGPLTQPIPPDKIRKNCPVRAIHWREPVRHGVEDSDDSDSTVVETPSSNGSCITLECESSKYQVNYVICTIPLGVLKTTSIFHPPLPEMKQKAMRHLIMGTVNKIFLEYDRPFLHPGIEEIVLLWQPVDESLPMSERWFRKIYSFTKVQETLLLGWVSGEEAEYMETLTFDIVGAKCTEILQRFLNDPHVPPPKKCVTTTWKSQPYTQGAYTCIGVGGSPEDIKTLAEPLIDPDYPEKRAIFFAGEHTHPEYYSTAHGAYFSGQRAAHELLNHMRSPKRQPKVADSSAISSWIRGLSLN